MRFIYLLCFLLSPFASLLAQSGSGWTWASTSGVTINSPGRTVRDVRIDDAGNVYAVGDFMGTMTLGAYTLSTLGDGTNNYNFDRDAFVVKYDAAGNVLWARQFGTAQVGSNQNGSVVAVDNSGSVYIGGSGYGSTSYQGFVVKYDAGGTQQWSRTFTYFDIGGINIGPDGNPIVMESDGSHKNLFQLDKATGNTNWQFLCTGAGSNAGSIYHNFVDAAGNSYITFFNYSAATVVIGGQSYTTTGTASFVVSVDASGALRWVDQINNAQIQLGFTIDPENGTSYIQISGGFGSTFQGVPVGAAVGTNPYLVLNNAGVLTSYASASPYKGLMLVKPDGIYTIHTLGGTTGTYTETYGPFFLSNRLGQGKDMGAIVKYDKTTGQPVWVNSFEFDGLGLTDLNTVEAGAGGVVVGGNYGTSIKFGNNLLTPATGPGTGYHKDFYVARFNPAALTGQPTTTWTGAAGNSSWSDPANWSNGVPNGNQIADLPAGLSTYPLNITTANIAGRLHISSGVTVTLPLNFNAGAGVVNDGTIWLSESGTFYGGFNSGQTLISGSGRVVIKSSGVQPFFYVPLNNSLEINCTGTVNSLSNGAPINGSLIFTQGIMNNGYGNIVMGNPDATITYSTTSYLIGTLQRQVRSSGTYTFPTGSTTALEVATLKLNGVAGPTSITASFSRNAPGTVAATANGVPVTSALNGGFWTITPNTPLTGGSYSVSLEERGFTNGVTNPAQYVVIKRPNSSSAWAFFGNNGVSTQGTGVASATASGITAFSDFAIGIATSGVNTVLPLRFIAFTGHRQGGNIELQWQTADERNNDHFEVEHSTDGTSWTQLATVAAAGTNANVYAHRHEGPAPGIHYYRIRQVDRNGQYTYSTTIGIRVEASLVATLYPNPVTGRSVTLELPSAPARPLAYTVSDGKGAVVQQGSITGRTQAIDVSALRSGFYVLKIDGNNSIPFLK